MILATRASKSKVIKLQLTSLSGVIVNDISFSNTDYSGLSLLTFKDASITTENSIRNIEELEIDELTARALKNPEKINASPSFNSLKSVMPIEQFEHLNQLLYNQKKKCNEHTIVRD